MGKIRINELARELEIKPNRLLELLPELGVTEKKTHSSSIDEDVAVKARRYFGIHVEEPETAAPAAPPEPGPVAERPEVPPQAVPEASVVAESAASSPAGATFAIPSHTCRSTGCGGWIPGRPVSGSETSASAWREPARSGERAVPVVPAAPAKPASVPAKPVPTAPRPGQILSGPRQPLPVVAVPPPMAVPTPAGEDRPAAAAPRRRRSWGSQTARQNASGRPTSSAARCAAATRPCGAFDPAQGHARSARPQSRPARDHADTGPADLPRSDPPRPDHPARRARRPHGEGQDDASHFGGPHGRPGRGPCRAAAAAR